MDYNWIEEKDKIRNAISRVSIDLAQKYNLKIQHNFDIDNGLLLTKNGLQINIAVTKSVPFEIWFKNEKTSSKQISLGHFLSFYFNNDESQIRKYYAKAFNKKKSDFLEMEGYYYYLLTQSFVFIEENFPEVFIDGKLNILDS